MSHSKLSVSEGKDYVVDCICTILQKTVIVSSAVWYKYSKQQQQTQTQTGSNPATRISQTMMTHSLLAVCSFITHIPNNIVSIDTNIQH